MLCYRIILAFKHIISMAKIRQLSTYEAQKIAAGEVVERPANIVKELIENSIDAGATAITLYLEDAGKKLIRIIDNGCGMSPEDAVMCIKHHATSKITSINDLETITTFGFRGEALSSIASVSKIILITKEQHQITGIQLDIQESTIINETVVSCNSGTDIAIHDLFYNMPARKKFLKTKETEWRAILHLFYALCLDYPAIHFKLYNENKLVHNCPAIQDIISRLTQLYEPALSNSLLLIESTAQEKLDITIRGAICQPSYSRYDRNYIFLFVNQRWVKNHKLVQAFVKGYQGMLASERYPVGFIFINIDPHYVDINIHPRKEEVRFLHPRIIESFIESTVKQRLEAHHAQSLGQKVHERFNTYTPELPQKNLALTEIVKPLLKIAYTSDSQSESQEKQQAPSDQEKAAFAAVLEQTPKASEIIPQVACQVPLAQQNIILPQQLHATAAPLSYKLIGQVLLTYVVIETEDGLVLIDQHAAHERILYEKISQKFNEITPVKLIFPSVITLMAQDVTLIAPYLPIFSSFGVAIEQISAHELIVQETPVFLKNQPIDDLIKKVIGWIHEAQYISTTELQKIIQEKVHAQMSCKGAIKAGDELTASTMNTIIQELYTCKNKLTCPHGRPTIWPLSVYEIEKKFKRNYK